MQKGKITYEFYYSEYLAGSDEVIPRKDFRRFVGMAEDRLAPYIRGEENRDEVARAICEAAEYLYVSSRHRGVVSETIDGYRADYEGGSSDAAAVMKIAADRLAGLGIFYMGVE